MAVRVRGFHSLRREEVFLNAVAYQQPQRVRGFRLCDEWKFVYKRLYSQPQRVRGFQPLRREEVFLNAVAYQQPQRVIGFRL